MRPNQLKTEEPLMKIQSLKWRTATVTLTLFALVGVLATPAFSAEKPRVAVLEFAAKADQQCRALSPPQDQRIGGQSIGLRTERHGCR